MKVPIALNKRWVRGIHEGMQGLDEDKRFEIMKPAAIQCSADIWALCEEFGSKTIETVDDLTNGWNLLRSARGLDGGWVREGEHFRGVFGDCGCRLVRTGLIELHPVQCCCSQSMWKTSSYGLQREP